MWSTFFYHTFDFSMAFDKFKRALAAMILLVSFYSHHFEIHATTFNKLLRDLTRHLGELRNLKGLLHMVRVTMISTKVS